MKVKSLSRVSLLATPWTAAYQAPPSMGFSRQEYWSGVPLERYEAFLSDQCKQIEENNRIEKTGDLFKMIRDTKGTFHAKMGKIKDRNGMDLTEAEDIKKMWQKYTEELYKKDLHNPDSVWCDHLPRARHLQIRSRVGLRKNHYKQN